MKRGVFHRRKYYFTTPEIDVKDLQVVKYVS